MCFASSATRPGVTGKRRSGGSPRRSRSSSQRGSSGAFFYLTHHAGGDDTSLWFYLPVGYRLPFSAIGYGLSLALVAWTAKKRGGDVLAPMGLGFAAYLAFIAFAPMCHLNYIWSIYPLGCVALAASAVRGSLEAEAPRPIPQLEPGRVPESILDPSKLVIEVNLGAADRHGVRRAAT